MRIVRKILYDRSQCRFATLHVRDIYAFFSEIVGHHRNNNNNINYDNDVLADVYIIIRAAIKSRKPQPLSA